MTTKTKCLECGTIIASDGSTKFVACPGCSLIQKTDGSSKKGVGTCISRRGDRECVLPGSHSGECDFGTCPKTWNGLQCGKAFDHSAGCSFVPRCEGGA